VQSHLIIFKEEKEAFVPCASHFVYRFPAVISHRERAETFDDQIPSASDPLFTRDETAVIHQVPRAFDGITAATAAQFLSFVRPSIYPEKKEWPLIGREG
jgi:hypothetical protein